MLKPYDQPICRLAFIFAHCGEKPDRGCHVYSISAVVISIDGTRKNFSSLVRYDGLTSRERCHSNISREMLAGAPDAGDVSDRIRQFLKPEDVVFVLDDSDHIRHISSFCNLTRFIDLGFAAEYLFPHLPSHSIKSLWGFLNRKKKDRISFSSDEIVELAVSLVENICSTRLNDTQIPYAAVIRYFLKKSDTLFGRAFTHIAQNYTCYFGGLFDACSAVDTGNWKQFLEKNGYRPSRDADPKDFIPVSLEHLEALYRGMADSGKGYTCRSEQIRYAGHVARALNDSAVLTIEAGTGTGKTQGYLIPVLEFLYRNKNARVVISTYTKSLQEQIYQRELTVAFDVFKHYRDIPFSLLKGKSSYICAVKLDNLYEETLSGPGLLAWLYFLMRVLDFRNCDSDSIGLKVADYLGGPVNFYQMLHEISAKTGCHSGHQRCPAQIVTIEASAARLIITNHHKLALLDQDPRLAGLFRNYVVDEANHFEHSVRNAFGEEVRSFDIAAVADYLESVAGRLLKRAAGDPEACIRMALSRIHVLKNQISQLRDALSSISSKSGAGDIQPVQYDHPAFQNGHIKYHLQPLVESVSGVCAGFDWLKDAAACRGVKLQRRTAERIKTSVAQLSEYGESLKLIETISDSQHHVAAFQCFRNHWTLMAHEVEVSDLIRRYMFQQKDAIVFTAATLTYKGRFDTFREIAGMLPSQDKEPGEADAREFRFEKIPSLFSKDAIEIIVPDEAVTGRYDNKTNWTHSVVAQLPELIRKNRGRTLVLFSSYADLIEIVSRVSAAVTESMYPLLIQQKGCPTVNLCDEFRTVKESVLFGVDTFWYGVDFKGDTLTQVIITRIPYPTPYDPIQMARKKILSPSSYWKRYHYDTGIKLKQGAGRLIRSDTDRGKIIILDTRFKKQMLEDG